MSRRSKKTKAELTYRGITYKSDLEISVAKLLYEARGKIKPKFKFDYEHHPLPYVLPEKLYWPDFTIVRSDGSVLYIEVKGYFDRDAQQKMLAVKEHHPGVDICFLFSRDSLIRKGGKMRYSDWCKKYGFNWAIDEVPERWLKV